MGLGWFDAIAGAALPVASGIQQGRVQAEELQRKREEEALRRSLLQAQIAEATRPREWQPTSMQEATEYELGIHPERTARPDGFVQSEWEKAGFPDQQSYLDFLGQKSRTEFPDRFRPPAPTATDRTVANEEDEGLAILNTKNDPAMVGPFGQAYKAIREQNSEMKPGLVAKRAMAALHTSRPDLFRKQGGGYLEAYQDVVGGGGAAEAGDLPVPAPVPAPVATPPVSPIAAPSPPIAPTAPAPPSGANPSGKRPVTQDQADYLRATGKWDDAAYEVVS